MVSKSFIKHVYGLQLKKNRVSEGLFTVEGTKSVIELLRSKITVKSLIATPDWLSEYAYAHKNIHVEVHSCTQQQLEQMSAFKTAQSVIAIAVLPDFGVLPDANSTFVIALDQIQDPGNMGTIIRIADWYGISHIVCSLDSADWHNPKSIQASMGSFSRVAIHKLKLDTYLRKFNNVYGTLLTGAPLYTQQITSTGILLIGNEGNGIHPELLSYITHPVTIPGSGNAESLNAAVAAAVCCDARARSLYMSQSK